MGRTDRILTIVVAVAVFAAISGWVTDEYGGASYWPSLVSQFGATLLAVVLALEFESRRERRALERADKSLNDARRTEARKRLLALVDELEKNQTSIDEIVDGLSDAPPAGKFSLLHPQLLNGAWSSSGERLGDLLAEYDLVARLSTFYGRLEELRWRIRHRTQAMSASMDPMSLNLAIEMQAEVGDLITKIRSEEANPDVRPIGLNHVLALGGTI